MEADIVMKKQKITENVFQKKKLRSIIQTMDLMKCYELLETNPGVPMEKIKQIYKDLVSVWHPDRFTDNPRLRKKAEEKLKLVNQAFDTISNVGPENMFDSGGQTYIERRRYPRTQCFLAVNHATKDRIVSSFEDTIEDISAGGAFLRTREKFHCGQGVLLSFPLPRFGRVINLTGEVVRCSPSGIGVEFKISDKYRKFLTSFV